LILGDNTILFAIPPLKAQITILSKNLGARHPSPLLATPMAGFPFGHKWTLSAINVRFLSPTTLSRDWFNPSTRAQRPVLM